jgi:ectoine hydroxylase
MNATVFTQEDLRRYREDGFLVVKGMLSAKEVELLGRTAREDRVLDQHSFGRADGEGGTVRLSVWNHPTDTIYGNIARSESLVSRAEQLLEGEVYHYHSKMIMKDAKVGGAWTWHQDYGYWYQFGFLFPFFTSVSIAVDPATRENGCLQVIRGSHQAGRVHHKLSGEQAGADLERVEKLLERLELVYVEMDPGDALFFHSNLLHRSDQNQSDHPRWSMIVCYNSVENKPYDLTHLTQYMPLTKIPDATILEAGDRRFSGTGEDALFHDVARVDSAVATLNNS